MKNLLLREQFAISGYSNYGAEAKTKIINMFPEVVLCSVRGEVPDSVFAFVQDLLTSVRNSMVVLVTDNISVDLVNKAAGYGIRKVMPLTDVTPQEFSEELKTVLALEQQRSLDSNEGKKVRCKVIGFFSGKGGTGKSTVAVNTAVYLAREGKRVMLLDLDLQCGDVAISLDADTKYSIVDLVQDRGGITIENINNFSVDHSSGLRVLCAPKSAELAEYVQAPSVEKIIDIMRPFFEYVILDMSSAFNDITITACESCEEIFMVYNTDILSLKNAKMSYDILDQLHQKDKLRFIINKYEKGIIKPEDFTNMVGLEIYYVIPYDGKTAISCVNKGQPAVLSDPRSSLGSSLRHLTDKVIAEHTGIPVLMEPEKKKRKLFPSGGMKKSPKKKQVSDENYLFDSVESGETKKSPKKKKSKKEQG
ncbi:MAG: AAA family ATPase [Clostridia bacterium]|nr:AAA family ATPase [Clostridia bacterium]